MNPTYIITVNLSQVSGAIAVTGISSTLTSVISTAILTGQQGIPGVNGSDGAAATISVGSTTTGAANVTNSGSSSAAVLNFTVPQGVAGTNGTNGIDGSAATIAAGTTTTLAPGSSATVTNVGTSSAATFNFGIPRGTDGVTGSKWYEGAGVPSTTHADGDLYLNTTNGDVYQQASGVWGIPVGNIKGPAGTGTGDMLKATYDPTSKNADAFSQDNMVDGTTNKNYSATDKTKLAGVSGSNTGDETTATIKTKLGITTLSGSNTGDQTTVSGNAGTATALQTARNINGVAFNGTADITIADSTKVPTTTTVNGHALSSNVSVTADDVLPTQTGNSGKVLGTNGTTSSWQTASSGSGDVVGPAGATDTAVALFDGTTGKLLKNSTVKIDVSGNLTAYTLNTSGGDITSLSNGANVVLHGNNTTTINGNGGSTYIKGGTGNGTGLVGNVYLGVNGTVNVVNGIIQSTLDVSGLTANRVLTLPDATGMVALTTSNITGTAANVTGTVAVTNGGTGRATGTTAYSLVATGTTATGAQQTLANGATTTVLVGGGASALPVWTTATGSGAPVRATSPTMTTPTVDRLTSTVATGTAPLVVTSTTKVTNLNADQVDGFQASGTPTASTILPLDASATYPQSVLQTTTLGYAATTTSQGSITTTETDLTSLSVTVTVPAGGRNVKITAGFWPSSTVANDTARLYIKEGTNYLGFTTIPLPIAGNGFNGMATAFIPAPSAGSHTYKLSMARISGSGTLTSNAGAEAFGATRPYILAELS